MPRKKSAKPAKNTPATGKRAGKPDPPPAIPQWYTIREIEQLKSLSNPIRQRILAEFAKQPSTTKQVADRLGEPPTKLYHHVEALAGSGLIVLVGQSPKRGTTERFYRAVAQRFRVADSCFGAANVDDEKTQLLLDLLDSIRTEVTNVAAAVDNGSRESALATMASAFVTAPAETIEEYANQLIDHLDRLSDQQRKRKKSSDKTGSADSAYRISIIIHPASDMDADDL